MGYGHGMETNVGRMSNEYQTNLGRDGHGMVTECLWYGHGNIIKRSAVTLFAIFYRFQLIRALYFSVKIV